MTWNYNIDEAPRSEYVEKTIERAGKPVRIMEFVPAHVILATKCGKVTRSYWIPDAERWNMLSKDEQPECWQPWPLHPRADELMGDAA